jgi:hypothetical protein
MTLDSLEERAKRGSREKFLAGSRKSLPLLLTLATSYGS